MKLVYVNSHNVKESKELDDNNPNKNVRKDPKTIAALVNEGRFSYLYTDRYLRREQEPFYSALPDAGRTHKDQEPDCKVVFHLLPRI